MGVASSMSISLLTEEGQLWGLIACHHDTPLFVPYEIRMVCDLLAQTISTRLNGEEQHAEYEGKIQQARDAGQQLAEKKANLRIGMTENKFRAASAKIEVVQKAATDTPERPVGEVWAVAEGCWGQIPVAGITLAPSSLAIFHCL